MSNILTYVSIDALMSSQDHADASRNAMISDMLDESGQLNKAGMLFEPMCLRFSHLKNENIAEFSHIVGAKIGDPYTNVYYNKNTWEGVMPLLQALPELKIFGDVLHIASAVIRNGNKVTRIPLCLVETMSGDDTQAENFSRGNLRNSSDKLSEREWVNNPKKYFEFIRKRNAEWLQRVGFETTQAVEPEVELDTITRQEAQDQGLQLVDIGRNVGGRVVSHWVVLMPVDEVAPGVFISQGIRKLK